MPTIEEVFKELYIDATEIIPVDSHGMSKHLVYQFVMKKEPYVIKVFDKNDRMRKELMAYDVTERMRIPAARVYAFGTLRRGNDYMILTRVLGTTVDNITFDSKEQQENLYESAGNMLSRFHDGIHINSVVNKFQLNTGRITSVVMDTEGEYLSTENYKDNFKQSVTEDYLKLCNLELEESLKEAVSISYQWFMERIEKVNYEDIHFGFCHNDYNENNIMAVQGEITGVMDFETAGFGNTERDICSIYIKTLHKDQGARESFFRGYKKHRPISAGYEERLSLYLVAECYKRFIWAMEQAPNFLQDYQVFLTEYVLNIK